eukprot:TRINITY_DN7087_c0_g1_i1.p1 TRINITY_DN7087_c0_g1~~TRINITY_DN7087_c0_g1_i1.p1  ORF type:complete len:406 (+),score=72.26 TRINITY_DN7087_c0_g1_i1:1481-2698(+)
MSALTEANNEQILDDQNRVIVHFTNRQYAEAFIESRDPASSLAGWEFMSAVGTMDMYRRKKPGIPLYEYQGIGTFADVHGKLFHDSYLDIDFQAEISQFIYETTHFYGKPGPARLCVKFPFPLSDREYIVYRESRTISLESGIQVFIILMEHVELPGVKLKKGVVRVKENFTKIVIEMDPKDPTNPKLFIKLFEDPHGSIPPWVINYGAKLGIPTYMKEIRKGTKKYAQSRLKRNLSAEAPPPPELPHELIKGHLYAMPPKPHRDEAKRVKNTIPVRGHRRSMSLESVRETIPSQRSSRRGSIGDRSLSRQRATSQEDVSTSSPYPFPPVLEATWDLHHWRSSQPVTPETVIYWLQGFSGIPEHEEAHWGPALRHGQPPPEEPGVLDSLTSLASKLKNGSSSWRC